MKSVKIKRIESNIIKCLSDILVNEASDSLLKTITVTGVDLTSDLSYAKVYFTSLSPLSPKELVKELDEAAGYLRSELAQRIEVRHTPKLRFAFDESIAYGQKIEKIISEINQEDQQ